MTRHGEHSTPLVNSSIRSKSLNSSISCIDKTFTGTLISDHSGNGNEEVLHIPQTPRRAPRHQTQFFVIPRTLNGFKYFCVIQIFLVNIFHYLHTEILESKTANNSTAQSAGWVEYADSILAEE